MTANYEQPGVMNKRVRFFDGQFLQDQDFVDEQKYHQDRRQRMTQLLHVAGIANGLEVRTTAQPFQVRVTTGTAVDQDGRLLVLETMKTTLDGDGRALLVNASEPVALPAAAADSERWLYIAYHQMADDLQASGDGVEGETRWHEAPYLFTAVTRLGDDDTYGGPAWHDFLAGGPPPPILLARLTVDANGAVTLDNTVRRYSGLRLPGLREGNQAAGLRAESDGRVGLWLLKDGDLTEPLTVTEKGCVGLGVNAPAAALEIRTELKATIQNRTLVGLRVAPNFNQNNMNGVREYGLLVENGNVGIGTDSPPQKLTVSGGNIQLDGAQKLVFSDFDDTNNLKVQLWTGYGLGINGGTLFYAANGRHSWRDNHGATERMALTTGVDGGLTVSGTGNSSIAGRLGLGTTAPAAKLDISASSTTADGWLEAIRFSRSEHSAITHPGGGLLFGLHSDRNFYFADIAGGTFRKYLMLINADSANVTVNGGLYAGNSDMYFTKTDHSHTGIGNTAGYAAIENAVNYDALMILGRSTGNGRRVKLWDYLEVNGNLDVQGTVYARDRLRIDAGDGQYWEIFPEKWDIPDKDLFFQFSGNWSGWVSGWLEPYGSGWRNNSDRQLKEDIKPIEGVLDRVLKLRPVTYRWKEAPNSSTKLFGFIAQEVEELFPDFVKEKHGFKSLNYDDFAVLAIASIQEQQQRIILLEMDLSALKSQNAQK